VQSNETGTGVVSSNNQRGTMRNLLITAIIASLASFGAYGQSAKDDLKDAGKATKRAAKSTGRAVKKGTKTAVNKSAGAVSKGAEKVKEGAVKVKDKTKP
jgi:hypothetical protein